MAGAAVCDMAVEVQDGEVRLRLPVLVLKVDVADVGAAVLGKVIGGVAVHALAGEGLRGEVGVTLAVAVGGPCLRAEAGPVANQEGGEREAEDGTIEQGSIPFPDSFSLSSPSPSPPPWLLLNLFTPQLFRHAMTEHPLGPWQA